MKYFPFLLISLAMCAFAQNYDLIIRNGHIIDGTGSPWYSGDIAIQAGRIAAIGQLADATAERVIDAHGLVVAPGFIDMLGQSELTILVNPHLPSKIFQGITTEITGEGDSVAPLNDAMIEADRSGYEHYGITPDWRTFREYFARLEKQGLGINLASFVGATSVRRMVLGDDNRAPSGSEMERMKELVREAMRDGAVGLSTRSAICARPVCHDRRTDRARVGSAAMGGIYATHMRSEGDAMMPALDEVIRIAREANIPAEIWHLKAAGKNNWGRMPEIVAKIERARDAGVDIAADTYAYTAWFNSFSAFIPPWAHDGGDAKMMERLKDPAMRARIRKDMETPSSQWDNEWQEVAGPEGILVSVVQNPKLVAAARKNHRRNCETVE